MFKNLVLACTLIVIFSSDSFPVPTHSDISTQKESQKSTFDKNFISPESVIDYLLSTDIFSDKESMKKSMGAFDWMHFDKATNYFRKREIYKALDECKKIKRRNKRVDILLVSLYISTSQIEKALAECKNAINQYPDDYDFYLFKAIIYLHKFDFEEARKECDKVLSKFPNNPLGLCISAILNYMHGKRGIAISLLDKSIEIEPKYPMSYLVKSYVYTVEKNWEDALKAANDGLQVLKWYPELTITKAFILSQMGKLDEAADICNALAEKLPKYPNIYSVLGNIYLQKKDYNKAEKYYNKSIKVSKNFIQGYIGLANTYFLMNKPLLAETTIKKVILTWPDNITARYFLVSLYASLGRKEEAIEECVKIFKNNPKDIVSLMMIGFVYGDRDSEKCIEKFFEMLKDYPKNRSIRLAITFSMDDVEDKESMIKKLVSKYPDSSAAHCVLGDIYFEGNKWNKAVLEYDKALKIGFEDSEDYSHMGFNFRNMYRYEKALICYREAIKLNPNSCWAHSSLAVVLRRIKRYDEALVEHKKALEINPEHEIAHASLGHTYGELKQYGKAQNSYQKALEINPKSIEALNGLGILYHDKGEYDKAIEGYKKALKLDPEADYLYGNIANSYKSKGLYDEVIKYCEKALKINPNHISSYRILGGIYSTNKMYIKAEECYKKAIQINPKSAYSYHCLAYMYKGMELYDKAIEVFKKTLVIDSKYLTSFFNMGDCYCSKRMYSKAIEYYKQHLGLKENAEIYKKIAQCYFKLGKYSESLDAFRKGNLLCEDKYEKCNFERAITTLYEHCLGSTGKICGLGNNQNGADRIWLEVYKKYEHNVSFWEMGLKDVFVDSSNYTGPFMFAVPDKEGKYVFSNLPDGEYIVYLYLNGFINNFKKCAIKNGEIIKDINFVIRENKKIFGHVKTGQRKAVPYKKIYINNEYFPLQSTVATEKGYYEILVSFPGTYQLQFTSLSCPRDGFYKVKLNEEDNSIERDLILPSTYRISGKVYNKSGKAILNISIGIRGNFSVHAKTNKEGSYNFKVKRGKYEIVLGKNLGKKILNIEKDMDSVDFVIDEPCSISGCLKDEKGNMIICVIEVMSENKKYIPYFIGGTSSYKINEIKPGKYVIKPRQDMFIGYISKSKPEKIEIDLKPGQHIKNVDFVVTKINKKDHRDAICDTTCHSISTPNNPNINIGFRRVRKTAFLCLSWGLIGLGLVYIWRKRKTKKRH